MFNNHHHGFNGPTYGLRAWFVDIDNNPRPASYVGFDICSPGSLALMVLAAAGLLGRRVASGR